MEWQDLVIAIGSGLFVVALLPTVFSDEKPAWSTSAMTGSILYVFAFTYYTLGLKLGAITAALSAVVWTIILVQTILARRKNSN